MSSLRPLCGPLLEWRKKRKHFGERISQSTLMLPRLFICSALKWSKTPCAHCSRRAPSPRRPMPGFAPPPRPGSAPAPVPAPAPAAHAVRARARVRRNARPTCVSARWGNTRRAASWARVAVAVAGGRPPTACSAAALVGGRSLLRDVRVSVTVTALA
jgi:hypothetical protein